MKIQVLIPMSGQGTRYQRAGYKEPKPLIPVNGTPMIERLLAGFPLDWACTFVLAENHRGTGLPETLQRLRPEAKLVYVAPHTEGPGRALRAALPSLDPQAAVLVSYCDYQMEWDPAAFARFVESSRCEACVVSYRGFHAHYLNPVTYAYSRMDGERVVEVKEKGSFTANRENEFASCGAYYFRSPEILKTALDEQDRRGLSLNGESYTSLTVQAWLESKADSHVRVFEIPHFFQWGTPEDLVRFEYWEKTFAAINREIGSRAKQVDHVVMPMAGLGSRFRELGDTPKPFLPVEGVPMYRQALRSLPRATQETVIVGLEAFRAYLPKDASERWVLLKTTPPGQALSTQEGFKQISGPGDLVVSSCDHAVVMDAAKWERFRQAPDCDAAIFTVRGFPGCHDRPQAFAYVDEESGTGEFPRVRAVSVKKPLSATPSKDALLVGTFWFRSADVARRAVESLVKADVRVNGELYLDSVFELMLKEGLKVRSFPLEGYVNWGDPDSLAEALYWQEVFLGRRHPGRGRWPGVFDRVEAP